LGIGDWGLGIGDWAQSPIPNPQSPNLIYLINNENNDLINNFLNIFINFNYLIN